MKNNLFLFAIILVPVLTSTDPYNSTNQTTQTSNSCSDGYYLTNQGCISCFPCQICQYNVSGYQCQKCFEPYMRHQNNNCYLCTQVQTVSGIEQCRTWIIPQQTIDVNLMVKPVFLVLMLFCLSVSSVIIFRKKNQQEKSQEYQKNKKTNKNITQQTFSNNLKLMNQLTDLQKEQVPNEDPCKLSQCNSTKWISDHTNKQCSPNICCYCQTQDTECQTDCGIKCHIECLVEQYKNVKQCFRCKSLQFHAKIQCEGCGLFKVPQIICDDDCTEIQHINCYGRLNYQEFCNGCSSTQKQNCPQ